MKPFEKLTLIIYAVIVIVIYVIGILVFELYTTKGSSPVFWSCLILIFPVSIYYCIRMTNVQGKIWYGYAGNFIISYAVLIFLTYFTVMKVDLLMSYMLRPSTTVTIPIISVKKSYVKKSFDHTNVTVFYADRNIEFETSRSNFFLLEHKKQINSNIGVSYAGNYYITNFEHSSAEKWEARKAYLKNWWYRNWWLWAFFALFILSIVISVKYFPNSGTKVRRKPFSLAQAAVIWLIIMGGIFVITITGIYLYGLYHLINKN